MEEKQNYTLRYYSTVETEKVEWLWYPYIPFGKITIVQGDPGEGKSTFLIQLTALLTTGKAMPDGSGDRIAHNVIYQAAEDGLADTVRPRLEKAGADCSRVAFLDLGDEFMNLDDSRFEKAIVDARASLLVIDPMQSFLSADTDPDRPSGLRPLLTRLARVANRTKCAVVLVGHLNKKSSSSKSIYRGLGSIDLVAVARSILLIGRDAENPNVRVIAHIKSSLAPEGKGYMFELDPGSGFRWIGESEYAVEDILSPSPKITETKKERAKELIRQLLLDGDVASTEIMAYLKERGIGRRTAQMARAEMDIVARKRENAWYWHLEENDR